MLSWEGEHPGSIVVECSVLGDRAVVMPETEATENVEMAAPDADDAAECEKTVDEKIAAASVHGPEPRRTIGSMVQEMLLDETLDYPTIVDRVVAEFPEAKTSTRSVASVAAALRRKGVNVPTRR